MLIFNQQQQQNTEEDHQFRGVIVIRKVSWPVTSSGRSISSVLWAQLAYWRYFERGTILKRIHWAPLACTSKHAIRSQHRSRALGAWVALLYHYHIIMRPSIQYVELARNWNRRVIKYLYRAKINDRFNIFYVTKCGCMCVQLTEYYTITTPGIFIR